MSIKFKITITLTIIIGITLGIFSYSLKPKKVNYCVVNIQYQSQCSNFANSLSDFSSANVEQTEISNAENKEMLSVYKNCCFDSLTFKEYSQKK